MESVDKIAGSPREPDFKALFEGTPSLCMVLDPDLRIVAATDAYLAATSTKREAIVGQFVTDVFPDNQQTDATESTLASYKRVLRNRVPETMAVQRRDVRNPSTGAFESRLWTREIIPILDPDGSVANFIHRIEDVTEATNATQPESELRTSLANLEAALESMTDAVFIADADGKILDFNDAFATFHKFKDKSECYNTIWAYSDIFEVATVDGIVVPVEEWAVRRALRGEVATNAEYRIRRMDTGETWVGSFSFGPIRDKDGSITGGVVTGRDVTERKRIDDALSVSEQRLRSFYDSGLIGVLYWNMDGVIVDANDKFFTMLGYTREDLTGGTFPWADVTPSEYLYLDAISARELIETGANAKPYEKEFIRKDGARIPVVIKAAMLDDARFNGVAFVLDVTERKQAESAMREIEAHNRDFNRRTIQLATDGKLEIVEPKDLALQSGTLLDRWTLDSLDDYSPSIGRARDLCAALGLVGQSSHDFMACAGEMMSNAIKHAGTAQAACYRRNKIAVFVVTDQGAGIPAINLPDVAFVHGYSTAGTGGLGYKLIIGCAHKVYLATGPHGTTVSVEIKIPASPIRDAPETI